VHEGEDLLWESGFWGGHRSTLGCGIGIGIGIGITFLVTGLEITCSP